MTEQLVLIVIVVLVLVLLDGLRRKWSERRDRVVLKIDKSSAGTETSDEELFTPELPNGGARTLPRDTDVLTRPLKPAPKLKSLQKRQEQLQPEHVPVLLDTVEVAEELIEHTNVFADSSSTPADEPANEEATMGIYQSDSNIDVANSAVLLTEDSSDLIYSDNRGGDDDDEWEDDVEEIEEEEDDAEEEWEEGWDDDEDDEDEDEDDLDDDEFDDDLDDEEDEDDEDEDEFEEEFPDDYGDFEDEEEAGSQQQITARRIEPAFGSNDIDTQDEVSSPGFARQSGGVAPGTRTSQERNTASMAGKAGKKNQGELFQEEITEPAPATNDTTPNVPQEVIIINVMAKSGQQFEGRALLKVLQAQGLRLGDMSIFHKHSGNAASGSAIFSMANMVKPGTFDLSGMDSFTTPGVSFFLQLPNRFGNMAGFDQMFTAANALKQGLDGELKDENRSVLTRQTLEHYRQRIRDFELRQLARK